MRYPNSPLSTYETSVKLEWIDYNGHMSEPYYVLVFGHASDGLYDQLGIDEHYRNQHQCSVYTLEAHINYLQEVGEAEPLRMETQLLEYGDKKMRFFHRMYQADTGQELASTELFVMFVDMITHRTAAFPDAILDSIACLAQCHEALPAPAMAQRKVGQR